MRERLSRVREVIRQREQKPATADKQKGAHLLAPQNRYGRTHEKTLSARPLWGVLPTLLLVLEIARFVLDSSRSYAN